MTTQLRSNVRNLLLNATPIELEAERAISQQANDADRLRYVEELIQERKQKTFDRFANKEDWRAPINWTGFLTHNEIREAADAIHFFTATNATTKTLGGVTVAARRLVHITADGYRAGPAGP